MLPFPLTNFETQKYYKNELKCNGFYSRNNLPKISDGTYVINLDEYKSKGTHWIALLVNGVDGSTSYDATYFDSFGLEHSPKEIEKFIANKSSITNIYRIQAYNSIMLYY